MGWQELERILGDQWVGKEVPLLDGKNYQVTLQRAHIQKGRRDGGYFFFNKVALLRYNSHTIQFPHF